MTHADKDTALIEASHFRAVVIAPTYNNAATLVDVLDRIENTETPLIVVNDGATDETGQVLEAWAARPHRTAIVVLTHSRNRGKAAAMRTGFAHARELGYSHAVTMDTDGQLDPADIPALLHAARAEPTSLVLGRRSEETPGLPKSNLVGWYTSGLGLWLETGQVVHDSQCGLRVYPLRLFDMVTCWAGRFGFEAEIIARAAWAGFKIVDVPVSCIYPSRDEHVSHLRPLRDGAKGFFMHWGLAIRRLIPWPGRQLPESMETTWSTHTWLSPIALWRQIRSSRLEQLIASSAFGHGVFLACMPLGLWAFVAATYGSRRLHHNWVAAMAGACLSIPPIGPLLAKIAITIGHVPLHLSLPDFGDAQPGADGLGDVFRAFPVSWCIGGVVLGTILHWVTISVIFTFLHRFVPVDAGVEREP